MSRILISGGAGFIGSHLCDRLLGEGHEVIVVDNFFTGRKENISHHFNNPNFEYIRHDIVEPISIEADLVYHLACPASPVHYQSNPIKTIKTNVLGTLNMLGLAKRVGARFLLASTSEVYGDPEIHPQVEGYWGNVNPIGPRSCYDEGKRVAETLTYNYNQQHLSAVVIRIFNTYGPRMLFDDGRVVSNFIVQALKGEAITVYGEGSQTRSFCYVSDLVDGMIRAMSKEDYFGPVNLGNPEEFTILELAKLIIELTESSSKIVFKELPKDDPTRRRPDISVAERELSWKPSVKVRDGLSETITEFRERIKTSESMGIEVKSAPQITQ